jgi:hypothetical protein
VGSLDRIQDVLVRAMGEQTTLIRATVLVVGGMSGYQVSLNGNIIQASALDDVAVSVGDSVLVAVSGSARGQSEAFVLGRMSTSGLHPATGSVSVVPPSSPTITVVGADGVSYTAFTEAGYTPSVNDNVEMVFVGGYAYVTKAGITPTPAPPAPVGSSTSTVTSGTTSFPASDSATYWNGLWSSPGIGWGNSSWLYSGTFGGSTMHAAWFYGGGPTQLAGRTITGGRVWLGPREGAGNYNSVANIQIWSHSSGVSRPGGDISLVNGPTSTVAQPWQGLTAYGITQAQAQDLVNGGGLALVNGDYAAFQGVQANAQSGKVDIDWSR